MVWFEERVYGNRKTNLNVVRIVWYNVMTDVWTCGYIVLQLSHYLMVIERPKSKIHVEAAEFNAE